MSPSSDLPSATKVGTLLAALRGGHREAFDDLVSLVYTELRAIARHTRRSPSDTLTTTAIVHEAYLKLAHASPNYQDHRHFLAVAGCAMRQIVTDHARAFLADKRGGGVITLSIDDVEIGVEDRARELLALDDALVRLAALDGRLGQIVELRFFAGLSVEEAADVLETSPRTVKRDWRRARAFLFHVLHGDEATKHAAEES